MVETYPVLRLPPGCVGIADRVHALARFLSSQEKIDHLEHCRAARGWAELQGRLMLYGFVLQADPAGPVLCLRPGHISRGPLSALGADASNQAWRLGRVLPSRGDLAA